MNRSEYTDFDEFASAQAWDTRYRPTSKSGFHVRTASTSIGGIELELEQHRFPVEVTGTSPGRGFSFVMTLGSQGRYTSRACPVDHHGFDVYTDSAEVSAQFRRNTGILCLMVPEGLLAEYGDSAVTSPILRPSRSHGVRNVNANTLNRLRDICLSYLARKPPETHDTGTDRYVVEDLIMAISGVLYESESRQPKTMENLFKVTQKAREFMLSHITRPPTILELCNAVNVPERTLHNAFSQIYGVPPKQFLKAIRLNAARDNLQRCGPDCKVSHVAMDLGFYELGYFSRDYKAMFGEYPSETHAKNSSSSLIG